MTRIVTVRGVFHTHLDRARIGVGHLVFRLVLPAAAGSRHLVARVAAAPVLEHIIHADGPPAGLVIGPHGQLPGQHQLQVRRIALDDRVVQVADIEFFRHLRVQVAAEVVRRAEGQDALRVQNRVPLHADLPLDARNAVIVLPHRRGEGSLARNGGRGHHERTVDVAPVILCGDTHRKILERLPAQADLDLRHVALALVVVLNIADVGVNGVFGIVFVVILGPVTHRTVRREAETESQPLRHRHLESDVVKVERVVGRPFPDASDRLGVVVVLPLQPEVEKESLLRSRAVSRGVEQVDRTHRTHGHTRTAHRAHLQRTGGILFADAVHRIGRECVNTACLGRNGKRKHRCSRDNQLNQGVLHLHCTLKFDPIRKRPDYNLQISCF